VIVKLWSDAWAEFLPSLASDVQIRKVICSTNAIESVNAASARPSEPVATSRPRQPLSSACIWP
jgi:transposase-like protein